MIYRRPVLVILVLTLTLSPLLPLTAIGQSVPELTYSIVRRTEGLVTLYLLLGGQNIGYITMRVLKPSSTHGLAEDLIVEHGLRMYRLRQVFPDARDVRFLVIYTVRTSDGEEYGGSMLLNAYGFFKLTAVVPKRLLGENRVPLELTTLYVMVLARTDEGVVELGSIDLLKLLREAGVPVSYAPGYRKYIVNVDCSVEGYSLVQCRVVDGYGNPVALVYVTGVPSVYVATRLYVNSEMAQAVARDRSNITVTVSMFCGGLNRTETITLKPGEPLALHRLAPSMPCRVGEFLVTVQTKLMKSIFDVASLVNISLVPVAPKPKVKGIELVNYTATGMATWIVELNTSSAVEASAGLVRGAIAWWFYGGGPGRVRVTALVEPGYSGGLQLTLVLDDGSVLETPLPPPPPLGHNYTAMHWPIEPVVLPGQLYYQSRIESLERALKEPGLPYWEQMSMAYELFSRKRALETGEIPGLVAYGLLNESVVLGDYLTVIIGEVEVSAYEQCYADLYLMMGAGDTYFVEVPLKRIRLANGTYGVSVSRDHITSWLGIEPTEAKIHGIVVHVWNCRKFTIKTMELITAYASPLETESTSLLLLASTGLVPAMIGLGYLLLRLRRNRISS